MAENPETTPPAKPSEVKKAKAKAPEGHGFYGPSGPTGGSRPQSQSPASGSAPTDSGPEGDQRKKH